MVPVVAAEKSGMLYHFGHRVSLPCSVCQYHNAHSMAAEHVKYCMNRQKN